jgi:PAS domain S-box-containing protein
MNAQTEVVHVIGNQLPALTHALALSGFTAEGVTVPSLAAQQRRPDLGEGTVIFLNLSSGGGCDLNDLKNLQAILPRAALVVLVDEDDEARAQQAIRQGAQDYVSKDEMEPDLLRYAVRHARKRKEFEVTMERRNRMLRRMERAAQTLSAVLELDELLDRLMDEISDALGAVAASVWLVDEESGELVCRRTRGPKGERIRGARLPPGKGFAGWAASHDETLAIPDSQGDNRHVRKIAEGTGIADRSILLAPLHTPKRVIGVLEVTDPAVGRFDEVDRELIESLAAIAAIAIANARIYESAREEIQEQRRLQQTLLESEAKYRNIVERANDSIGRYALLPQPGFTYVNPATCTLTGYSQEEYYADPQLHWKIVHPEDRYLLQALEESQGKELYRIPFTIRWLRKDGEVAWTEQSLVPMYDEEGNREGVEWVTRDITARVQAEDEIHRLNAELEKRVEERTAQLESTRSALESALAEHKAATVRLRQRNRFLEVVQQTSRTLNATLDLEQVLSITLKGIRDLFEVDACSIWFIDRQAGELVCRGAVGTAAETVIGWRLPRQEGLLGWAVTHGRPLLIADAFADPRHFAGIEGQTGARLRSILTVPLMLKKRAIGALQALDATVGRFTETDLELLEPLAATAATAIDNARLYQQTRDHLEELKTLLREREEAQATLIQTEKTAALGRLTASLAHEINNPLQALQSGFRLLLNPHTSEEKRDRYLIVASKEVERLIDIVERVLGFYRPTPKGEEATDVRPLLEDTLLLVHKRLEQGGVTVHSELTDELPPVRAVGNQLKQVFLNLILNAQQAMEEGGELWITATSDGGEAVRIAFRDKGIGIPAERLPNLFNPNDMSAAGNDKRRTGLGLAISYSIVERHGGHIEVESTIGQGSTFTVVLPVEPVGMGER